MATTKWDDGRYISLGLYDGATVSNLSKAELYGFFFYNMYKHDSEVEVTLKWGPDSAERAKLTLPGTVGRQGRVVIGLLHGKDTSTSVSVTATNGPLARRFHEKLA